jgi:hypothetical protein
MEEGRKADGLNRLMAGLKPRHYCTTEAAMCTCPHCCYYCADEVDPGWIKQDGCKPPKPCQDCNPDGSYPMQERDEPCSVKNDDVMNERM